MASNKTIKKIAVIGHLAIGLESLDGQTIKTKVITQLLNNCFGEHEVLKLDTHSWKKNPLRFAVRVCETLEKAENILLMLDRNGLRVIAPMIVIAGKYNPACKLHYSVIGGWLPSFLEKRRILRKLLKTFDGIYVETQTMKLALEKQGFHNVYVVPNCKELTVLSPEELVYDHQEPYKLCTFSRVMREKGIEDAVNAVQAVNKQIGRIAYTLDIYGQIDPNQTQWFSELENDFLEYIRYAGTVPFDKSVEILKDYYALLFPTRFYTEGIPGTIIDAYAAGVPVIAAKWESFGDVIEDGITGIGYPFGDNNALISILTDAVTNPELLLDMKRKCLQKVKAYNPEEIIKIMIEKLKNQYC